MDIDTHFATALPTKRPKYGAKKTVVDGITFSSKKEAKRYEQLRLLLAAGSITDLKLQQRIRCVVNGVKVCDYVSDFSYYCRVKQDIVWEDVKGFKTDVYKLKKKLVKACTGIDITEI